MKQWPVCPLPTPTRSELYLAITAQALQVQGPHAASLRKTLVQLATVTN